MPQNSAYCIAQTPDGFLWLGTEAGLARFDGKKFVLFTRHNTESLPANQVDALTVDHEGTLWIGTISGLAYWKDGVFHRAESGEPAVDQAVLSLAADHRGRLWIGTEDGIFIRQNGNYTRSPYFERSLVVFTQEDPKTGAIFFGTPEGLFVQRHNSEAIEPYRRDLGRLSVEALTLGKNGTLWVGTYNRGLLKIQGESAHFYNEADGFPSAGIRCLLEDKDGVLWIGFYRVGVVYFENGVFKKTDLPETWINGFLQDFENHLWIATLDYGLIQMKNGPFTTIAQNQGLPDSVSWAVFEDGSRRIWVGTNKGPALFSGDTVRTFDTSDGLPDLFINAFAEDAEGRIWIGTDNGPAYFDETQFLTDPRLEALRGRIVYSILKAKNDALWFATGTGLFRLENDELTRFGSEEGLPDPQTSTLHEDQLGRIWVTTNKGMGIVDGDKVESPRLGKPLPDIRGFGGFCSSEDGSMWVGTTEGLLRITGGSYRIYSLDDGLYASNIYYPIADAYGWLWLTSVRGVFKVALADINDYDRGLIDRIPYRVYGSHDGIKNPECNFAGSSSAIKTRDERLWFVTSGGAITINPSHAADNIPPKVVLESIIVNGKPVAHDQTPLKLGPDVRLLTFHFNVISFSDPKGTAARYRLIGFDQRWSDEDDYTSVNFTNLDPGSYFFELEARNADHIWNREGPRISFKVKPKFYQTPFFWFLPSILLVALIFAVHKARVAGLKRNAKKLEALVLKATQDLQASNRSLETRQKELEALNLKLKEASITDPLTKLHNRRYFQETIGLFTSRSMRNYRTVDQPDTPSDLLFFLVDFDHFKTINDRYGHTGGDAVLAEMQGILRSVCRDSDLLIRWGGEEFLVLAPNVDRERGPDIAERLRKAVAEHPFVMPNGEITHFSSSIGFASFPFFKKYPALVSWEQVLDLADHALYQSKEDGRNTWNGYLALEGLNLDGQSDLSHEQILGRELALRLSLKGQEAQTPDQKR